MHIPNTETTFFYKSLHTFANRDNTFPIEFGYLTFDIQGIVPPEKKEEHARQQYRKAAYNAGAIPFSELSYARREGVLRRDISLDILAGFSKEASIIKNPHWTTIHIKLGPEEYARRDFLDFMESPMMENLIAENYQLRSAHFQIPLEIPSRGDVTKAAHIFMRRQTREDQIAGLELTIPKGKESLGRSLELLAGYRNLEGKKYSF